MFLKYSYFYGSALLLTVSEKLQHQKKLHFKENKTYIEQSKDIFFLKIRK